jgi:hypothetical protein
MTMIFIDSKQAFEEAISQDILSENETAPNYVGNFMYMGTKDGLHQFKHIVTRKYCFDLESAIEAGKISL